MSRGPRSGSVWDTSVLSHAAPELRQHGRYLIQARAGVITAAPVIEEWLYGTRRKASSRTGLRRWDAVLRWISQQLGEDRIQVLPYGRREADMTARLRMELPAKALAQDIRIASCAWLSDLPVLTSNRGDFAKIASAIEQLGWGRPLRIEGA